MSRSETARLARNSTSWLLLVLCTALLAWRIDFRVEQCRASTTGAPVAVAFFDANERNIAVVGEAQSPLDVPAAGHPLLLSFESLVAVPLQLVGRHRQGAPPVPPEIFLRSIPLFANPPPAIA